MVRLKKRGDDTVDSTPADEASGRIMYHFFSSRFPV